MKKQKLISGIILHILSIIVLITPLAILTIAQKDIWFIEGADKVSIGFIIMLIFALCLLKGAFNNIDKRITTFIALAVMMIVVWLLESIMSDLFYIILCSMVGYGLYCIVNYFAVKEMKYVNSYEDEKAKIQARKELKQQENNNEGEW